MTQVDDLSRSLAILDQNTSLIAVVELSEASWLVAGLVPGVDRQPLKKHRQLVGTEVAMGSDQDGVLVVMPQR